MPERLCENPPLFRYTWPGRDENFVCLDHALQLKAVADAMSFHLQLIPLSGEEQTKKKCHQKALEEQCRS